jgi:hypothetical protein
MVKNNTVIITCLTILFFFSSFSFSQKKSFYKIEKGIKLPTYQNTLPQSPANNSDSAWDWTKNVYYNLYITSNNIPIRVQLPWFSQIKSPATILGNYPKNEIDFYPNEGWVLLWKNFGNSTLPVALPNFVLYNKYRGTFRIFFYPLSLGVSSGEPPITTFLTLLQINETTTPTPLFTFYKNVAPFSDDYKGYNDSTVISSFSKAYAGGWCYADFNIIGYDNKIANNYCNLKFHIIGLVTQNLYADEVPFDQIVGKGTAAGNIQASGGSSSIFANINKDFTDYNSLNTDLKIKLPQLKNYGNKWWTNSIDSLENYAGSSDLLLTKLSSIAGLVDNVTGILGKGDNQISASIPLSYKYPLHLEGTLSTFDIAFPSFPVPGSLASEELSNFRPINNEPLGIYNVVTQPILKACLTTNKVDGNYRAGDLYIGLDSIQIIYNDIKGLALSSATVAIGDTNTGLQTPYVSLDSIQNVVFKDSIYSDEPIESTNLISDYNNSNLIPLQTNSGNSVQRDWWSGQGTHSSYILQGAYIALQLKFTYSTGSSTDTSYFLKTYPVKVVGDTNIFHRTILNTGYNYLTAGSKKFTFSLEQNYPNPFNPVTTISYQLIHNSRIKLVIFNILGRNVSTLVDGEEEAGKHIAIFDGSRLASGIYFCQLTDGNHTAMKKMILMK